MAAHKRVAVVQAGSVPFDPAATMRKAIRLISEAGAGGARLALFPEAFIGGYPKGCAFNTPVGARMAGARDMFVNYFASAIEVPGPETEQLAEACRAARTFAVIGIIERCGGTLYCTVLFIDPVEGLVGKHRKLMPTGAERLIWGFGDGSTLKAAESPVGRVGAVICWENYMPMLRMAMYGKGVQIYCAPTADDRDTWPTTMQHIALEGRCYVLSACQYLRRDAFPVEYQCEFGSDPQLVLMRGGSMIVSPLGKVLVPPHYGSETILYSDLDLNEIERGKYDFDVVGHYARPDVFQLRVNEQAMPAVAFEKGADPVAA
jgi:nitrilase